MLVAYKANGIAFLNTVMPADVRDRMEEGVMICAGHRGGEVPEIVRKFTRREMPW